MMRAIAILFLGVSLAFGACKTSSQTAPPPLHTTEVTIANDPHSGAPTVGMAINIDGTLWHAASYGINQLGTFWVVKGTHADGSVFSIMLPDPLATAEYPVEQGGPVSVTYSTNREKGFLYFAPFSANNGTIKTTLADGYLHAHVEVTISNNAIQKKCIGTFSIKL